MTAVQRDAQTVQALASRAPSLLDRDDVVAQHLAAWLEEIDRGIDATVVVQLPARETASSAPKDRRARRAVGVAGATVVALVISSGAAAAVTGDPLAAVKAPLAALNTINPFVADDAATERAAPADDRADDRADADKVPSVARTNQLLADAQRAIAQGDLERAADLLDQARAAGGGRQQRIDQVTDRLDQAIDGQPGGASTGPKGQDPKDPVDKDPVERDPKSDKAVDKDPKDKDPVDQDPGKKDPADPAAKNPQGDRGTERDSSSGGTGGGQSERPGAQPGAKGGAKSGRNAEETKGAKADR